MAGSIRSLSLNERELLGHHCCNGSAGRLSGRPRNLKVYTNTRLAIRRSLLRNSQPCRRIVSLMSESLERQLGLRERLSLRLHLLVCVWCVRYFKQIKLLRQITGLRAATTPDFESSMDTLSMAARERIAASLQKSCSSDSTKN